jgi:hypothetical protein
MSVPVPAPRRPLHASGTWPTSHLLASHLQRIWSNHSIAGPNNLELTEASPGSFRATSLCRTPRLWFLLSGHTRTFRHTLDSLKRTATASAPGCWFVTAFVPQQLDVVVGFGGGINNRQHTAGHLKDAKLHSRASDNKNMVSSIMHDASQKLEGRFAFAIVERGTGSLAYYPGCWALYWHGSWALALWAAAANGVNIAANAVLIRSRPDIVQVRPLANLDGLQAYFSRGARGRHVAWGMDGTGSQSALTFLTSFGAFSNDVALPLERAAAGATTSATRLWYERGMTNGAGYGRNGIHIHVAGNARCLNE